MTIYTIFFHGQGAVPEFELGDFDTLAEAKAGVVVAMTHRPHPCRAELFVGDKQVAEIPVQIPFVLARPTPPRFIPARRRAFPPEAGGATQTATNPPPS